jgi:ubiquinone/menaquinone biosynthesis C-methylase UbiE
LTISTATAYRSYWRQLWVNRIDESPEYAAGRQTYSDADTAAAVADAVAALNLNRDDSLLDVGCCKGLIGNFLRQHVARYVGVDYIAGFRPAVVGDAVALPFRDGSFDKVMLAGVLCCMPPSENAAVLREMRRVVRPGGRGFVSCNPFTFVHHLATIYRRGELMDLARQCGWRRAWIAEINPLLDQAQYYFDMVVAA